MRLDVVTGVASVGMMIERDMDMREDLMRTFLRKTRDL